VPDGLAALEVLDQFEPALILLDMRLPQLDGWEFLQHYHKRADTSIPIIAVSAGRIIAESLTGVASFLPKPFGISELSAVISDVLN
jgi:DNA-binding response OmpR family regulator